MQPVRKLDGAQRDRLIVGTLATCYLNAPIRSGKSRPIAHSAVPCKFSGRSIKCAYTAWSHQFRQQISHAIHLSESMGKG